jgi:hypothetical protein
MNQNTEIIIIVSIIIGISIILLYIFMFPKISTFISSPEQKEMTINDLKISLNQLLNKNFINNYEKYNINPVIMVSIQPYISSMVDCFADKLIKFYNKNNVYNISDIINDINTNNIPYNFNKGVCKNSVIAGLSLLQNQYGKNFNFTSAINYLTNVNGNSSGFSVNINVYDSDIISASGNSQMYNFSKSQKDYLDNFKN